jgi:hypothetical protein
MNELLRPSNLGEILDRTANLYRSRFLVFFGLGSIPSAVVLGFGGSMVLLFAWATTAGPGAMPTVAVGVLCLGAIGLPLMLGATALSGAALCHAASALMMGESITISMALKAVWRRGWHYLGLYVLQLLIIFGAPLLLWTLVLTGIGVSALAAPGGASAGLVPALAMLFMLPALVVYGLWMLLRLCLAFPIAVVENAAIGVALNRAAALSLGTRWRMLALFLLGAALGWVVSLVIMVPLTIAIALLPVLNSPQHGQLAGTVVVIVFYGASFAVQALTMPVYAIALVLFYYDQRVRKEAFDIEFLMARAGMVIEPSAPAEGVPWMAPVPRDAPATPDSTTSMVPTPGVHDAEPAEGGTA